MNNFVSIISIILTVAFVPIIIANIPYFKKRNVVARRIVKSKMPSWVRLFEMITFLVLAFLSGYLFLELMVLLHGFIHPTLPYISSEVITFSLNSFFDLLKIIAVFPVGLFLGAILSNIIAWCIPAIRKIENQTMMGVSRGSFKEENLILLKFAAIILPIAIILNLISLIRI